MVSADAARAASNDSIPEKSSQGKKKAMNVPLQKLVFCNGWKTPIIQKTESLKSLYPSYHVPHIYFCIKDVLFVGCDISLIQKYL